MRRRDVFAGADVTRGGGGGMKGHLLVFTTTDMAFF